METEEDAEVSAICKDIKYLEVKEIHPILKREVTHLFFKKQGIDVVVLPATPRQSPLSHNKPEILNKPQDLELVIGDEALFALTLKNPQEDTVVSWSKDRQLLLGSSRMKMWNDGADYMLRISDVRMQDEGMYEIKIRNDTSETICDASLAVYTASEFEDESSADENDEDIKFTKTLPEELICVEGQPITLECHTNFRTSSVEWFFNCTHKLLPNDDVTLSSAGTVHRLKIAESLLEDEGRYKCIVGGQLTTECLVFVDERS